jgi:histidinol-phosphate phosphatase family protein
MAAKPRLPRSAVRGIAVFLDRDGTINVERNYVNCARVFKLLPDSAAAIRELNLQGVRAIVASNQSGVARGYLSMRTLRRITKKMELLLERQGAALDAVYYCPYHPDDKAACRKPATGMAEEARDDFGLDLKRCYMVGDNRVDVEFGRNFGARTVLVLSGQTRGDESWIRKLKPDCVAQDLWGAVQWVLGDIRRRAAKRTTRENR